MSRPKKQKGEGRVVFTLSLPPSLAKKLRAEAKRHRTTLSELIRSRLGQPNFYAREHLRSQAMAIQAASAINARLMRRLVRRN